MGGRGRDKSRAKGGERKSWMNRSVSQSDEKYTYLGKLVSDVEAGIVLHILPAKHWKNEGKQGRNGQTLHQK